MFKRHDWRPLLVTKAKAVQQVVVLANKEANKITQCPRALAPLYLSETLRDPQAALSVSLLRDLHRAQTLLVCKVHHLNTDGGQQKPVGFACLWTNETEPVELFICRANRCRWSHALFRPYTPMNR